jgi:uncharacterized protein (TIGR02757 family)
MKTLEDQNVCSEELRDFLEVKYHQYNSPSFIPPDPISIPHRFSKKEDIEISGFLTAIISWGQRCTILRNAGDLLEKMDNDPFEFILHAECSDLIRFSKFAHRTFNGQDCVYFIQSLHNIYKNYGGLEKLLIKGYEETGNIMDALVFLRSMFFDLEFESRTLKHFSNPASGSAAKRLNMFLRWMVRYDKNGVDFGIWKSIPASALICPLDVHTGNTARKLGLLTRKQNDRKAAEELTTSLRLFDAEDPVRYDFALFGLGIYEKFA